MLLFSLSTRAFTYDADCFTHLTRLQLEIAEREILIGAEDDASLLECLESLAFNFQSVGAGLQGCEVEAAVVVGRGAACLSGLFACECDGRARNHSSGRIHDRARD